MLGSFLLSILVISSLMTIINGEVDANQIQDIDTQANKDWTIMVYLDADNNLEGQGVDDFLEMAEVGSDSNVNIVVQMDRIGWSDLYDHYISLGYSSSEASYEANMADDDRYGDWTTTKRFLVDQYDTPISSNAISDIGEQDMGDPDTLYSFIAWSLTNYPADRYGLILWDHGDQWNGVCSDDTDNGNLLNM